MRSLTLLCLLSVTGFVGNASLASTPHAAFEAANQQFYAGQYAEAAEVLDTLATSGQVQGPAVFHNLGNARFRQGRFGEAIWAYRKGLNAGPGAQLNQALEHNLRVAREALQARYRAEGDGSQFIFAEPSTLAYRVTHAFSLNALVTALLVLWWAFMLLLIGRRLAPGRLPWSTLALSVGLMTAVASALTLGNLATGHEFETAVVVVNDAQLREGPDQQARGIEVPEGMEVRRLESVQRWERVEMVSGRVGWVQQGDLRPL